MKHRYDAEIHHRRSIRLRGYDYSLPGAYFVTVVVQDRLCLFGDIVDGEMRLNAAGDSMRQAWLRMPDQFPSIDIDAFVVMPNHLHGIIVINDAETPVGATLVVARPGDNDAVAHPVDNDTETPVGATLVVAHLVDDNDAVAHPGDNDAQTPVGATLVVAHPVDNDAVARPGDNDAVARSEGNDTGKTVDRATTRVAPTPDAGPASNVRPRLGDVVGAFKSSTTVEYGRGVRGLGWRPFNRRLWQRNYFDSVIRDDRELDAARQYIEDNPKQWELDTENPYPSNT